jgi:hypothetical protein
VFPHDFFKNYLLLILLFLILSWLRITTLDFLMKHYRLLQCFATWFFFMIFSKLSLLIFFFNIKLVKNLYSFFLKNIVNYNNFSAYNIFFIYNFFYKSMTTHNMSQAHDVARA